VVAATLGARPGVVFWRVTLPLLTPGLVSGTVLAFARALGEFGASVLVAGYIPGRTVTLALGIYHEVQLGRDDRAFALVAVSAALAFAALWTAEHWLRRPGAAR
jgi:molybdate transport system permease protein